MKLSDLEPQFLRYSLDGKHKAVSELNKADGIRFLCPHCMVTQRDRILTHLTWYWFEGKVPDEVEPLERWTPKGTGYKDLSFVLTKNPRSLQVLACCMSRAFLAEGEVTWKRPGRQ